MAIVRLINPMGDRRKGGNMSHRRHHFRRRRNPFASANVSGLAVKVAGGLGGGIASAVVPGMLSSSFNSGWTGVLSGLVVAGGGAWLLKRMSPNAGEGWLIGGLLQVAGRASSLLIGKNLVSFSLSGYGPLTFPLPTPGYTPGGAAMIPASAAVAKTATRGVSVINPGGGANATTAKYSKFAA
jgi:hypothetical protein